MRSLFILLFLGHFVGAWAQSPGIMGKKLVVAVTGHLTLPLAKLEDTYTYNFERKLKGPSLLPGVRIEGVVSRRTTVALVSSLTRSAEHFPHGSIGDLYFQNQAINSGIRIKHYGFLRKGNLAPMGGFVEYGVNLQLIQHKLLEGPPPSEARHTRWIAVAPKPSIAFGHAWLWKQVWGEAALAFMLPISNSPKTSMWEEYPIYQQFMMLRMGLGWLM